jgi:hypothetical protein
LTQQFSNFLETIGEKALRYWLNHLVHTFGVQHSLIREREPKEAWVLSTHDVENDSVDREDSNMEEREFIIANAEDCSFSIISHNKGPPRGYCLCKPNIIFIK